MSRSQEAEAGEISPAGAVITIGGRSGDFSNPAAIAVDSVGNVYVTDTRSRTIRKGVPSNDPTAPSIVTSPASQSVVAGSNVVLSVMASTTVPDTYQWLLNGNPLAGQTKATLAPPEGTLGFTFRNAADATYRHPDPIAPTALVVRWQRASGDVVAEYGARALLPLALARQEEVVRSIAIPVPDVTGDFIVSLAPATAPRVVIARETVRIEPARSAP